MSVVLLELSAARRRAWRRPAATLVAIVSMAVGLAALLLTVAGIRTAMFTSLPGIVHAERLVELGRADAPGQFDSFSFPDFSDIRDRIESFDAAYAYSNAEVYLVNDGDSVSLQAQLASGDYFRALGVRPAYGRLLGELDDAPGGDPAVAVLSDAAHRRLYGGDPAVVGRTVTVNGLKVRIVGVAQAGFIGQQSFMAIDLHLPLAAAAGIRNLADLENRGSVWLHAGARLAPGATLERARAELDALAAAIAPERPEHQRQRRFVAEPYRPLAAPARGPLLAAAALIITFCIVVLAQACANVSTMLAADAESRTTELAIRSALGASPARLAGGMLADAGLIAGVAGALGLLLAYLGRGVLGRIGLPLPPSIDLSFAVDLQVATVAVAGAMVITLAGGAALALRFLRRPPGAHLVGAQVVGGGRGRRRLWLVTIQTGLTVLMLSIAALMLRSLAAASDIDTGFETDGVWVASTDLTPLGLEADRGGEMLERIAAQLEGAPGIHKVSYSTVLPLSFRRQHYGEVRGNADPDRAIEADFNTVGPDFFEVFRLPVRGRAIGDADRLGAPRVAVVNETLARLLAPSGEAIGQGFRLGDADDAELVTVIGVVRDGRYRDLSDAGRAFCFLAARQMESARYNLILHSSLPAPELQRLVSDATRDILPGLPAPVLQPFERFASISTLPQRVIGTAATALGGVALLLATLGLYAAISDHVAKRTREFGVRRALGAQDRDVAREALGGATPWLAAGLVTGMALALALGHLMRGLLLGIASFDPTALLAAAAVAASSVCVAVQRPLRRALAIQPAEALRDQ